MANSYQMIDEKTWGRAMHCMVFRNSIEPAFCVTFEADVTNFKRMVKEQGISFTLAMVMLSILRKSEYVLVGFVFNEYPVTDIYFKVRPGYEFLAKEMVDYVIDHMPNFDKKQQFVLFNGQEFLMEEAKKRGFEQIYDHADSQFDFEKELNYLLPKGFHFVDPSNTDPVKLAKCCWYGFNNHEDKGQFENWHLQDNSFNWTPQKAYKGVVASVVAPSPHSTHQYDVIIADEEDEYACFSGMWWVPENKLAYMEPLCTTPKYRKMGLASAALSKHYHTLKPLGATHMTGGGDPFYEKLGFGKGIHWYFWKRK